MSAEQSHLEEVRDKWWFFLAFAIVLLLLILVLVLYRVHLVPMSVSVLLAWEIWGRHEQQSDVPHSRIGR